MPVNCYVPASCLRLELAESCNMPHGARRYTIYSSCMFLHRIIHTHSSNQPDVLLNEHPYALHADQLRASAISKH